MKRPFLIWILFIVVLTAPLLHAAEAAKPSGHATARQEILILNSYHPGYSWSDDEQAGIIDVFRKKDKNWLPVIEYLDLRRLTDGRHLAELKKLFRLKYQNKKFSAVIAMDNPALEFAVDNQAGLFGNAPIVFCGINNYTPFLLKGRTDVTGIVEAIDPAGTIEVMLRLHPAAREIFVSHDYTVSGLAARKEIEALIPRFGAKVRFRFADPLTMEELLKELERLPKNSLVLEIGFITDKSGHTLGISETTQLFSGHSPVPIYSTYEHRLGFGIVGGKLLSARMHGADAARIALRVLAGEKASAIPVVFESDSQFMFDYKVMSRFGIPLSALPEGSTVINKPVSFYAAHRVVIQTTLGIIGILLIVIFLLVVIMIQRRRSAIALRRSEKFFRHSLDNSPLGVRIVTEEGETIYANRAILDIYGYGSLQELNTIPIEKRYTPESHAEHQIRREKRKQGDNVPSEYEVSIVTKDGEVRRLQVFRKTILWDGKKQFQVIYQDITERKRTEYELSESEKRYRMLFNSIDEGFCIIEVIFDENEKPIDYRFLSINPSFEKQTGLIDAQGKRMREFAPKHEEYWFEIYGKIALTGQPARFVNRAEHLHRWYDVYAFRVGEPEDRQVAILFNDITERKQTEYALHQSKENFRCSLDDSPLGVRIVTTEGETIYANRAMLDIYGYDSLEELNTTPIKRRYTPESHAEFQIRREKRKQGDDVPSEYEVSIVRKDGEVRQLQVFRKIILWEGEKRFQTIYQDITERKRAETELRASQEQMRALAKRLQAVREEERTNMAREIHDELGGALTGLKIDLSFLARSALKIENDTLRTSLLSGMDSMIKSIDATIQTVRRIAMELRPGVLDDLGLVAALEWQLNDFQKRTGIRCKWISAIEYIDLDADLSTALFRIVQEALTNVASHSGATEVRVHVRAEADSFFLEMEDNGKGIEKEKTLSLKSLGLLGMRERVQMFGGSITVKGTPETGTKVTVVVPLVEKRKMDRIRKEPPDVLID